VAERRKRIRAEIEALGPHDWAGVYEGGGGFTGHVLEIAPQAGAAYEYWACNTGDFDYGPIASFAGGRFTLDLALESNRRGYEADDELPRPFLTDEWYLVRWCDERYLVPSSQMIPFCNAVGDPGGWTGFGRFPRRMRPDGPVTLMERDLPEGQPDVPAPYRRFLLKHAVDCSITAAAEPVPVEGHPSVHVVRTTVDADAAQGLLPGMHLRVVAPDARSRGGEVVYVGASSAVVDFRARRGSDPELHLPRIGWSLRAGPRNE
jgi:hypothetical protein